MAINFLNKLNFKLKGKFFPPSGSDSVRFRCNICGQDCVEQLKDFGRETPSCPSCGSTVRMRAIIHVLSIELFSKSLALPDFPVRNDIHGIGLSDWDEYAVRLAHKLNYKNTYYHQEPKLDIKSINSNLQGSLDFIISTDVFEHVEPEIAIAFENAHRLLKRNGIFIFSVPYKIEGVTQEHFPDLYKYQIININGKKQLRNVTRDGQEQIFDQLVFHGGEGATLEMRVFSKDSLLEEFSNAGFSEVKIYNKHCMDYGIYWGNRIDSMPIAARKII